MMKKPKQKAGRGKCRDCLCICHCKDWGACDFHNIPACGCRGCIPYELIKEPQPQDKDCSCVHMMGIKAPQEEKELCRLQDKEHPFHKEYLREKEKWNYILDEVCIECYKYKGHFKYCRSYKEESPKEECNCCVRTTTLPEECKVMSNDGKHCKHCPLQKEKKESWRERCTCKKIGNTEWVNPDERCPTHGELESWREKYRKFYAPLIRNGQDEVDGIEMFIEKQIKEGKREAYEDAKNELVKCAIEGMRDDDDLKGVLLYSKMLNYLREILGEE